MLLFFIDISHAMIRFGHIFLEMRKLNDD